VQHSVITANSFGFFFRGVNSPLDLGSNLNSSGTIPAGFKESASAGMARLYRSARDCHRRQEPAGLLVIKEIARLAPNGSFILACLFRITALCGQRLGRF
jgi:hypothetical protein